MVKLLGSSETSEVLPRARAAEADSLSVRARRISGAPGPVSFMLLRLPLDQGCSRCAIAVAAGSAFDDALAQSASRTQRRGRALTGFASRRTSLTWFESRPRRIPNVNRFASLVVILGQLWLGSPLCCCWFRAAASPAGSIAPMRSCCSRSGETAPDPSPQPGNPDCRCRFNTWELPSPRTVSSDQSGTRNFLGDRLLAAACPGEYFIAASAGPSQAWNISELPPPLYGADRLHALHRLNV